MVTEWTENASWKHLHPGSCSSAPLLEFRAWYQQRKSPQPPQFSSVQSLSHVQLFATLWTTAHQASLSITNPQRPPKPISIESMLPSNHLLKPLTIPRSYHTSIPYHLYLKLSSTCIHLANFYSSFKVQFKCQFIYKAFPNPMSHPIVIIPLMSLIYIVFMSSTKHVFSYPQHLLHTVVWFPDAKMV